MRKSARLLLFASAIVMAVGAFRPLVGTIEARDVRFTDLREGFAAEDTLAQIGEQSAAITSSLALVLLGAAAAVLVAALTGWRGLASLGVLAGLAGLAALAWRLNERFGDQFSSDYRDLFSDTWGLYLFGGGLAVSALTVLGRRERPRS
ncbi:hypothetical protein HLB23_15700 [Nocardia uniformis]|uniref:Uncharacterized protein n=1 Tax=Nocardia uniformis TaxID=53432 RepID=A0A849C0X4_9NOCA|nr:hypothetical protein [Nocardia uniformis]NNH71288.1 hypothetical protein [Nocardia uniformis]